MASDAQVAEFVGITNASEDAARKIIEMCGGDVEQSVMLWFTDEDLQRTLSMPDPPAAAGSSTSAGAPAGQSRQARRQAARQIGREDEQGVIHIDSDDEDVAMTDIERSDDEGDDGTASAIRRAQEEEDAAVAQRIQEELYRNGQGIDEDGVRAPMARTTETLVEPAYGGYADEQLMNQMQRRRQAQNRGNPFGRSIWEDDDLSVAAGGESSTAEQSSRRRHLMELFRPPPYMSNYTIEEAREEGKEEKKWIMANLQDMSVFQCQALNRDHWKNETIAQLIQENFIFLQYDKDQPLSEQFINLYFPDRRHENPETYPYVAIIDPRTGGKEKEWSGQSFPNVSDFLIALTEFLDRYSLDHKKKNPVSTEKRKPVIDVDRMTEDEQLELALKNSMAANGSAGQTSTSDFEDPSSEDKDKATWSDSKDKTSWSDDKDSDKGGVPLQFSPFQKIPSDRPHTEPPNDPSSTTRLQVRNPPTRIIRRFRLDDPVSRIYEWLKAEPLPGKEGVEFELKSVGQGDLIEHLDKTIKESGLANGTVMIEFVEEDA